MPRAEWEAIRRRLPELLLAAFAVVIFLGFLGSVDLWGKREQRAAAEALDTVVNQHWLIAEIQERPRLEKPPLPRWTLAGLMTLTGLTNEWVVRFPGALAGMACVGLIYSLGRHMGGREVGLASGLALCSFGYFISETRQAGNDAPLALFTTLALYAAWRRLHGTAREEFEGDPPAPADLPGSRRWSIVMYVALGLGILTKGPVILVLVGLTVLPYLALSRRFRSGMRLLWDGWGLFAFLMISMSWPVPVVLFRPEAIGVWYLEIFQKAGSAGIEQHKPRTPLAAEWVWMALPWTPVAAIAGVLPLLKRRGAEFRPHIWFPWLWAFANLAMFSFWTVAKPNYYVPCLPGLALLVGVQWVRLAQLAHEGSRGARRLLQTYWVVPFSASVIGPVVVSQVAPQFLTAAVLIGLSYGVGVVVSAVVWRRGALAGAMAPLVGSLGGMVLVIYGLIGPSQIGPQSLRVLANRLDEILPADTRTVMFFDEIDEGLWFYLRNRELARVPGSGPELNHAYDLMVEAREKRLVRDVNRRVEIEQAVLLDWLRSGEQDSPYVLIRRKIYDRFAPALEGAVDVIYREPDLARNEVVLLRAAERDQTAARASDESSKR